MKNWPHLFKFILIFLHALCFIFSPSTFAISIGDKAPPFKLVGHDHKTYQLSQLENQWIVLEWFNKDCPFIKKHYDEGHMQKIQKKYTGQKVNWFSVISSAKGKQGHLATADEAKSVYKEIKSNATAILMDTSGEIGQLYKAKTTPHMFIINPQGVLVYEGAIDDHPSTESKDIPLSRNYVDEALMAALAGKNIPLAKTRPYGCSVKY